MDVSKLRSDFPVLGLPVRDGRPLTYLDNAATTQKPESVVKAVCGYYGSCNANVHRSMHYLAEQTTELYEAARRKITDFIGAEDSTCTVFTHGATESINLVAQGMGGLLNAGDRILLTDMEHHSNIVPWQQVARAHGLELDYVPVTDDGELDMAALEDKLTPRVRLIAVTHVSNILGTVNPVARITALAHAQGAAVLVDAAQSVPHMPVDVKAIGCDFLVFSGHKMCGPTGVGVLYARRDWLEKMTPYMTGGEMIDRVDRQQSSWAELPYKFEAGTPNIAGVIGLGAAVDYLSTVGLEAIHGHVTELRAKARQALQQVDGIRLYGPVGAESGVVSFQLPHVHPHDTAQLLDREGVAVRAGHMCGQLLMKRYGVPALTRASFYFYNTDDEIQRLVSAVENAERMFT